MLYLGGKTKTSFIVNDITWIHSGRNKLLVLFVFQVQKSLVRAQRVIEGVLR